MRMGLPAGFATMNRTMKAAKDGSTWVLLARSESDLGALSESDDWKKIEPRKTVDVWTDDFSNILSVFKW